MDTAYVHNLALDWLNTSLGYIDTIRKDAEEETSNYPATAAAAATALTLTTCALALLREE